MTHKLPVRPRALAVPAFPSMTLAILVSLSLLLALPRLARGQDAVAGPATAAPPTAAATSASADPAQKGEPAASPGLTVSAGASVSVASSYMWRGFRISDGPVTQPTAWVKAGPVTLTSWMNVGPSTAGGSAFTEHDLTIDYSRPVGAATLSVGWTNYFFPDLAVGRQSNEFYAGIAGGGPLSPSVFVYHDVQEGDGTYAMLAIGHTFAVPAWRMSVAPSLSVGYNHHHWTDYTGISDVNAGVKFTLPTPSPHLDLVPFVNYSFGIDPAIFARQFYGGVSFAVK